MHGSLRGLGWNHTRGYVPLVATAQRFEDLFEGVGISWSKRSLKDFGDLSLAELVSQFDVLVIDHPHVGQLASRRLLLPLEACFSAEFLQQLRRNAVGKCFESYCFAESLWALPLDVAAPVSSSRVDLMKKRGVSPPETWDEVLRLAGEGIVAVPATPVDSLMNYFMLCCSLGEPPFRFADRVSSREVAFEALRLLRDLIRACSAGCLGRNPIQTYREMVCHEQILYCPFAFGYSNYSRPGYAPADLEFGGLVTLKGRPLQSTLGGAGIAISAHCSNLELALAYLAWVVSPGTQGSLYYQAGGQPYDRTVWRDFEVNLGCNSFFSKTLPTVEEAYLRPRYNGYVEFQNRASSIVYDFLTLEGDPAHTLAALNKAYQESVAS